MTGPKSGFVTVKERAPGALTKPNGKKFKTIVGFPVNTLLGSDTPFAWIVASAAKFWPEIVTCN
jgi:hypothetical protein